MKHDPSSEWLRSVRAAAEPSAADQTRVRKALGARLDGGAGHAPPANRQPGRWSAPGLIGVSAVLAVAAAVGGMLLWRTEKHEPRALQELEVTQPQVEQGPPQRGLREVPTLAVEGTDILPVEDEIVEVAPPARKSPPNRAVRRVRKPLLTKESQAGFVRELSLKDEVTLVRSAHDAVRTGDWGRARIIFKTHQRRYGTSGQLIEEINALETEAECREHPERASEVQRRFLARWPQSTYADRLSRCDAAR